MRTRVPHSLLSLVVGKSAYATVHCQIESPVLITQLSVNAPYPVRVGIACKFLILAALWQSVVKYHVAVRVTIPVKVGHPVPTFAVLHPLVLCRIYGVDGVVVVTVGSPVEVYSPVEVLLLNHVSTYSNLKSTTFLLLAIIDERACKT